MNDREMLLNAIFFPRSSFISKDDNDHLVEMEKNIRVGVRFFISDKTSPTILFFHGNAELSQEYDDIASIYNEFGINFIVADYRGYGLSDGTPTKSNLHSDANTIFSYIKNYLNDNEFQNKLIIMGRSLGSASACEIISNHEQDIDGCVIESGFGTEIPLMRILDILPEDINYNPTQGFENHKKVINYNKALLVIHAEMDDIIPLNEAKMLFDDSRTDEKEFWIIPNANHNNILIHTGKEYFKRIKKFIDAI